MQKPRARATKGAGRAAKRGRSWVGARARLRALLDGWALAPFAVWLLGQLEAQVWLGALVAELHFQLGLSLLLAALVACSMRRWLRGSAWLLCGLLFFAPLWPVWRPVHQTSLEGAPSLRVAQCQLAGAALSAAQLASWLGQNRFDVVSLGGLVPRQRKQLGQGSFGYLASPGHGPDGLLFVRTSALPKRRSGSHVSLRVGHCDLDISQVDTPSLLTPSATRLRGTQLRELLAEQQHKRSLYVGTLGSRSAAHDLQSFMAKQGLRDVRLGHGRLATAPGVLGALGLPVDQVLVRGWIAVTDADVSAPIVPGAHRTLHATLQLTEPRCR